MTNARVDGKRLWQSLMDMAAVGATARGGVCRIGLSEEDRLARDLFRSWCEGAGYRLRVDVFGNDRLRGGLTNQVGPGDRRRRAGVERLPQRRAAGRDDAARTARRRDDEHRLLHMYLIHGRRH